MRRTCCSIWLATVGIALTQARADEVNLRLVQDGKSDYVIVVAHDAPPATSRGAAELHQYLLQISGADLPVVDDTGPQPSHAILVGPSKFTDPLDAARLGDEGFVLRSSGATLTIAGPGPRGSMYGCSSFLETLGVRWFTPKISLVPRRATISLTPLNISQTPAFEYREPFFTEAFEQDWAAHNKVNGNSAHLDASTGGRVAYSDFVHTFDALIPVSLYDAHPEYFPLIGGKRVNGYVQRCLTNPEVLALAVEGVRRSFREHPDAAICSVSQNDCASWCKCDACKEMTKRYGAHSGLYLWFANQVAAAVEKDLPGKLIDTLAYQFTEAPPTGIVPRKNVRVRLCPISVCESHPCESDDFPASKAFATNLAAWSKLTDTLYIWHYNTDFAHYLMPFPDFGEFPADTRLYRRSGVKGIFFEGDYAPGGGGSDAELRSYVMAKLLWDTNVDTDALVTEWMKGVYGPAWQPMRRWFDMLHEQAGKPANHLRIYDAPGKTILSPAIVAQGDKLFDEASTLASSPLEREYVEKARLALRYVKLMQEPRADETLGRFVADVRQFGITQISEGQTVDQWEHAYRQQPILKGK